MKEERSEEQVWEEGSRNLVQYTGENLKACLMLISACRKHV